MVKKEEDNGQTELKEFLGWNDEEDEERELLPILQLESEKEYQLQYTSSKRISGKYGETVLYTVIDLSDGEEKVMFSKSKRLAYNLLKSGIRKGDKFTLKRGGIGFDIQYKIKKIERK